MYGGNSTISSLIRSTYRGFTTEDDAKEIEAFFKNKDVSKFNLSLAQCLDTIRTNAKWLDRSKDDVISWLQQWKTETLG